MMLIDVMNISIIIPVYNVAPFIERCLKSVMSQTYSGCVECLIVDDCGSDDSMAIAERIVSDYKGSIQFQIIHHDCNRGLSAARNTGIDAAKGDYVFFLDSDDELALDCIGKLARPIQNNPDIEIVMGNYFRFRFENPSSPEKWKTLHKEERIASNKQVRNLFYDRKMYSISAWNKLIKKDFLVSNSLYFKEGLLHEDWLWTHHVLKYLCSLYILPDITYLYYKHPHSITMGTKEEVRAYNFGIVYEEIANSFTLGEEAREAVHYLRGFCSLLCENPEIKSLQKALRLFSQALADGQHSSERFKLSLMMTLSRNRVGRMLLSCAIKLKRKF